MMVQTKKVAIVGIQGLPAHYGGFETLAENLIRNKTKSIEYTVFCSMPDLPTHFNMFESATLKYVHLHSNGMQSILYDFVSMLKALKGYDTILILGVSGCVFLPLVKLLCSAKFVVNIDGLEHKRKKWNKYARWFLRFSERMAVKFADTVIADNKVIADYVMTRYERSSEVIAYGGDHVLTDVSEEEQTAILARYGLNRSEYALTICRIEPENNIDMILDTFKGTTDKLVVVGNFHNSSYSVGLMDKYGCCPNILMINAVYDKTPLYVLRMNAKCYIHGHSAGGTNPSLVEAMFFGRPVLCYDVNYNRETTDNQAVYFSTREDLRKLINQTAQLSGISLQRTAVERYTWPTIVKQYENLY